MFISIILRKFHSIKVVIVLFFLCNSVLAPFHALHNPYRWTSVCFSLQNEHLILFAIGVILYSEIFCPFRYLLCRILVLHLLWCTCTLVSFSRAEVFLALVILLHYSFPQFLMERVVNLLEAVWQTVI